MKILCFHLSNLKITSEKPPNEIEADIELEKLDIEKFISKGLKEVDVNLLKELKGLKLFNNSSLLKLDYKKLGEKYSLSEKEVEEKYKALNKLGLLKNPVELIDERQFMHYAKHPGLLLVWLCINKWDNESISLKCINEIDKIAQGIQIKKIVVSPFVHLDSAENVSWNNDDFNRKCINFVIKKLKDLKYEVLEDPYKVSKFAYLTIYGHERYGVTYREFPHKMKKS